MPPKAQPGISKKTEAKRQEKIIEDKTFGLKNKNKSKVVQSYVKSVANQVKQTIGKGGESKRLADEYAEKAAKKKEEEKKAFLNTLFKTVKKVQEENEEPEEEEVVEDKYEEIDFYTDQRLQVYSGVQEGDEEWEDLTIWRANKDKTEKICRFFLEACENGKYGWKWICPNGITCIYKHALPAGYTLKRDQPQGEAKDESGTLEERLELERALLDSGTPVTFERFMKWKEERKLRREKDIEKKRVDEAKKTGGKGLNVLSGKALFSYDPTLFQDDAEALDDAEYEEEIKEEEEEKEDDGPLGEDEEYVYEEEPVGKEWGENGALQLAGGEAKEGEEVKKKRRRVKKKKVQDEDNVQINEDVFLGEEDVELPEDDS
jgi:hypothetical protein